MIGKRIVRRELLALGIAGLPLLVGCGSDAGGSIKQPIAVTFTAGAPASLVVNTTSNIVAHVANDSTNAGIDWTLTCTGGACGSITAHTASDALNIYTAPATAPPSAVTIKATSTADSTKSVSGMVTITRTLIEVTITTEPPGSLATNAMVNLFAHVNNDPSNAGVDWTLSCGGGDCGSITPHTASDAASVYTAPATIPPSPSNVTILAASTADPTEQSSVFVQITGINPNDSKLNGQYAFLLAGWEDSSIFAAASVGGSFVADGNGTLTSGVIDRSLSTGVHLNEAFTGTYDVGNDNRGTLTVTISSGGDQLQFLFALKADGNGRFIGFAGSVYGTNLQGSGVIMKQDTSAFALNKLTGDYAFGMEGFTLANGNRSAAAGRFTTNGAGALSSATIDVGGPLSATGALTLGGNITAPSASTGRGTLAFSATGINTINLAYYVVSASELLVLDVDASNRILYTGRILAQNRPGGGFAAASFNSTVVFELTGYDVSHSQSNTGVGFVTPDGGGNVTAAFLDQNADATFISAGTTGTYTFDADGNGRAVLSLTGVQPNVLYFIDANKAFFLQGTPAGVGEDVTFGLAEPQSSGLSSSAFTGTYVLSTPHPVTQFVSIYSGVITSTGTTGTFAGTWDFGFGEFDGEIAENVPVAGTYLFTAGQNGRATVTLTQQFAPDIDLVLWFISPSKAVGVVSDASTPHSAVVIFEK